MALYHHLLMSVVYVFAQPRAPVVSTLPVHAAAVESALLATVCQHL